MVLGEHVVEVVEEDPWFHHAGPRTASTETIRLQYFAAVGQHRRVVLTAHGARHHDADRHLAVGGAVGRVRATGTGVEPDLPVHPVRQIGASRCGSTWGTARGGLSPRSVDAVIGACGAYRPDLTGMHRWRRSCVSAAAAG